MQRPALEQTVNEAGVKNVSGARRVDCLDAKSGGGMELLPVPGQDAFFAQRGRREAAAKSLMQRGQGLSLIGFFHQTAGGIPPGDGEVDALQEFLDAWIEF